VNAYQNNTRLATGDSAIRRDIGQCRRVGGAGDRSRD
jgi:hypothetical protein